MQSESASVQDDLCVAALYKGEAWSILRACAKNYFCLPLLHPPIHSQSSVRGWGGCLEFGLKGKYLQRLQLGRRPWPYISLVLHNPPAVVAAAPSFTAKGLAKALTLMLWASRCFALCVPFRLR